MYRRARQAWRVPRIVRAVRAASLTYLSPAALSELHDHVTALERRGRSGILIEAGCARGGSAIVLAAAKTKSRPLYVYDVFGMIPPPSDKDGADVHGRYRVIASGRSKGIAGHTYYGYERDLLAVVTENFRRHGVDAAEHHVRLIKGLFQHTMHIAEPVALAHLDCDWYESVATCLQRIVPHLIVGGVLIVDDYDAWSGCRAAVDEYFADRRARYDFVHRSRLQIVRRA
jgi:asparagine synthase (glutamine-hydrolysing)